jgi:hypothetical protein
MALKDPDDSVIAIFKDFAMKNDGKSAVAGRPVFDDLEMVELHYPGSKNWSAHPATAFSHWGVDPLSGEQVKVTYAERFKRQYQQFKSHSTQTKAGTPLTYAPFLTEGRRAELRAQNIYTLEALASIDGQNLKNLGPGGREMKNAAMEFIEDSQRGAVNSQMQAEIEALRAKNQIMEEDLAILKKQAGKKPAPQPAVLESDEFADMTLDQLRAFVTAHTGQAPLGSLNRKNLLRLAREAQPKEAAE